MKIRKFLLIFTFTLIFFSINISFADIINLDEQEDNSTLMPNCGGLLPDNYEYISFLRKVADSFIADNTKRGDIIARKIFVALGLRHSSILKIDDNISKTTAFNIDKIVSEKLCEVSTEKTKRDLWTTSTVVKDWVALNIDNLTKQVEGSIQLSIQLRNEVEASAAERRRRKRKTSLLQAEAQRSAKQKIRKISK